jgi:NADPH-dependent curcumin reductase CurA
MAATNIQVLFANRPSGWVKETDFVTVQADMPKPGDGEVLIRNIYLSVDPYMRGRMNDARSYAAGFELGKPVEGGVVGQIVESRNDGFKAGTYVMGMLPWAQFAVSDGKGLRVLDPKLGPLSYALGVLGMPGLTAYVGLLDIGAAKEGETVFVSAASGAVGSVVGQIAKIKGCRVVGSAGSDEKVAYITDDLGFDAGFNYKSYDKLGSALSETCPEGIDVYFENVGGAMLDAVLPRLKLGGRIALCGMISQYNLEKPEPIHNLIALLVSRATIRGFIVSDHYDRLPAFLQDMSGWLKEGKVKYREDIAEGLENTPHAFIRMLSGENFGKQLVKIASES